MFQVMSTAAVATAQSAHPRWEEMWSNGLQPGTSFDTGAPSKCLMHVIKDMDFPTGTCYVPGAGRAYDAFALANGNRKVTALDLAKTACLKAQEWLETKAQESEECAATVSRINVLAGDFFTDSRMVPGSFDMAWDCTFLCALDPSVREAWATRHSALIKSGGELVTLVFPIAPTKLDGPPFHIDVPIVKGLLEKVGFEEVKRYEMPVGSHISRAPSGNTVVRWRKL